MPLERLSRTLGYRFSDPALLQAALTHRSAGGENNERLEFLGDAVLGFVVSQWLYEHFPAAREGELSRLRANLVRRDSLAEIARGLELGQYLKLGSGELKSGGHRRDSILADALEALFGAILLDSDIGRCSDCILRLYAERFKNLPSAARLKDAKTRLQEYLQSRRLELPVYQVRDVSGKAHSQRFVVECRVQGLEQVSEGCGSSRRRAEQAAAQAMLGQLGVA